MKTEEKEKSKKQQTRVVKNKRQNSLEKGQFH